MTPFFAVFLSEHYDFEDMTNGENLDEVSDDNLFQVSLEFSKFTSQDFPRGVNSKSNLSNSVIPYR